MAPTLRERLFRQARRETGLADFEKAAVRLTKGPTGRRTRARDVPGEPEFVEYRRLKRASDARYAKLIAAAKAAGLI